MCSFGILYHFRPPVGPCTSLVRKRLLWYVFHLHFASEPADVLFVCSGILRSFVGGWTTFPFDLLSFPFPVFWTVYFTCRKCWQCCVSFGSSKRRKALPLQICKRVKSSLFHSFGEAQGSIGVISPAAFLRRRCMPRAHSAVNYRENPQDT